MKFIAIFAAALLACAHASILPNMIRQAVPEDAIGKFTRAGFFGGSCLQTITHNETVNDEGVIPHSVMSAQGTPCTDGGSMAVLGGPDEAKEIAQNDDVTTLIDSIVESGESVIYAVEKAGRKCGAQLPLGNNTLVIILKPSTVINIGFITLRSNLRYMIVDDPGVPGFCFYRAPVRSTATPEPAAPEASAETTDSETPEATGADGDREVPATTDGPASGNGTAPGVVPVPGAGPGAGNGTEPVPSIAPEASPEDETAGTGTETGLEETPELSPSPEDDDDICFPHDAIVELEDGTTKTMDQVEIGDRVRVSGNTFSDVFMFTHKNAGVKNDFVRITTHSGETIRATRGHYLYIDGRFAAAVTAKVGSVMELANGALTTISDVSIVKGTGLYNPQTVHGDIIVNGIRASTFTTTIEPPTAQALLAPLRLMFDVFGLSSSVFDNGADQIASFLPRGQLAL